MNDLRKVISIVDLLRDIGLGNLLALPKVVVLGNQSSGKSSLLEQIVGLDFLPRGSVNYSLHRVWWQEDLFSSVWTTFPIFKLPMPNSMRSPKRASRRNSLISRKWEQPSIPLLTKFAVRIKSSSTNQLCWMSIQNHAPTSLSSIYQVSPPFLLATSPKISTKSQEKWLFATSMNKGPSFFA